VHYSACKSFDEVNGLQPQGIVPWVCDSLPLFNRNQ
jgi:hypothetical protein